MASNEAISYQCPREQSADSVKDGLRILARMIARYHVTELRKGGNGEMANIEEHNNRNVQQDH